MAKAETKTRCHWVNLENPLYVSYHDREWGRAVRDDETLFEMLNLEGAQAGLSWETVLKKRVAYREVFDGFAAEKLSRWSDKKIETALLNPGIIRNRLKVHAVRTNAQCYLALREEGQTLSKFLWSFVDGKPIVRRPRSRSDWRATSAESDAMSKALKKRGFKFVGSTICYAFMQAVGMIDDHAADCYRAKG